MRPRFEARGCPQCLIFPSFGRLRARLLRRRWPDAPCCAIDPRAAVRRPGGRWPRLEHARHPGAAPDRRGAGAARARGCRQCLARGAVRATRCPAAARAPAKRRGRSAGTAFRGQDRAAAKAAARRSRAHPAAIARAARGAAARAAAGTRGHALVQHHDGGAPGRHRAHALASAPGRHGARQRCGAPRRGRARSRRSQRRRARAPATRSARGQGADRRSACQRAGRGAHGIQPAAAGGERAGAGRAGRQRAAAIAGLVRARCGRSAPARAGAAVGVHARGPHSFPHQCGPRARQRARRGGLCARCRVRAGSAWGACAGAGAGWVPGELCGHAAAAMDRGARARRARSAQRGGDPAPRRRAGCSGHAGLVWLAAGGADGLACAATRAPGVRGAARAATPRWPACSGCAGRGFAAARACCAGSAARSLSDFGRR